MTLINISNKNKCRAARVVGRQYHAKFLTQKDGAKLAASVEYWLLIEIQNNRWNYEAIKAALADVRRIL